MIDKKRYNNDDDNQYDDGDDVLKKESESTLLDDVETVGETALAVGAGAAFLYRHGGNKFLSEGANKFSRFLTNTTREFAGKEMGKDYTVGSAWKRMFSDADSIWNTSSREIKEEGIKLKTDNPNSLIGFLRNVESVQENTNRYAREIFTGEISSQVSNEFMQNFKDDVVIANKVHSFISQTANNFLDPSAKGLAGDIFTEDEIGKVPVDDILERMKELHKNSDRFKEIKKNIVGRKDVMGSAISEALKINISDAEKTFGSNLNKTNAQKIKDTVLGDRAVTVKEMIDNAEKFASDYQRRGENKDIETDYGINLLKRAREKLETDADKERFDNLYVDNSIRIDKNGEMHSFETMAKTSDKIVSHMAGTLPGTLLKLRDLEYKNKAPHFAMFQAGKANPILARVAEKSEDSVLKNNYMYVLGKTYKINDNGTIEHIKDMDGTYLSSGRFGTMSHMQKSMFGDASMRTSQNRYRKLFDFNLNGEETDFEEKISVFKKFGNKDWRGNVVNSFLDDIDRTKMAKQSKEDYVLKARELNDFYAKNVYALNKKSVNALKDQMLEGSPEYNLLHHINGDEDELLKHLLGKGSDSIGINKLHNADLISMLYTYLKDPIKARQMIMVKSDQAHYFSGKQGDTFNDLLKIEATKEVFIRQAERHGNLDAVTKLIDRTEVNTRDKEKMKRISDWGIFQYSTGAAAHIDSGYKKDNEQLDGVINQTEDLFTQNPKNSHAKFNAEFRKTLENMANENISVTEPYRGKRQNVLQEQRYTDYIHTRKSVSPLDVIRSINEGEFKKTTGKFAKQFYAGRNNAEDVTSLTMVPYFMMQRLSASLNTLGLGLSNLSSGSVGDLMGGFLFKRALPLAVGLTYLDYLNDSKRQITGSSFTTDFFAGAANVDLAARGVLDITGLSGVYNTEKQINPFLQYAFGKDDYQDYDTRKDYYENGYTPVRKGRFWSFGSVNEFRGGQIQYWMPNMLRQSTSNYKDVALYGDFNTKWSHSLLPTPTNPLSPLRAIFDPYYLEKLHYNDRPYPITGHMFEDGTPWGIVLNPTVGELIKPTRRMHQNRLNKDGVDVKRIIEQRNIAEMKKAAGNTYLIKWRNNEPELVDFTAFGAPTPSERVITVQTQNGEVTKTISPGYGEYQGGATPGEMKSIGDAAQSLQTPVQLLTTPGFVSGKGTDKEATGISLSQKIKLSAAKGNPLAMVTTNLISGVHPISQISQINANIINKAKYDPSQGVLTPEPIHYTTGKAGTKQTQILNDPDAMADLLTASSGDRYVQELAMSGRNLAGIYGWLANSGVGFGDNNVKQLSSAQNMNSISRSFWDLSIGGLGGEGSEIGRRFFQEFRRANQVNPLRNTMSDWLPDRFRNGDAYTVVPDGEARLPGRGYVSLNKLHPDQFGRYGAFDRMKILSDIAPQSPEYRIWAQIASKTITDPELRKQLKDVKKRRSESAKQHEFYDYKFLGRGLDYHNETIEKVIDNNHFKLIDDKTIYRLAGVRVLNDPEGKPSLVKHLHAGMDVTIAVDENKNYRGNDDDQKTINAAVFINGDNLAQDMIANKEAKIRKGDTSAAGTIAQYSMLRRLEGKAWEVVSHIDVPYFSDKYARIRSPLESYNAEQVYGTSYQTWSDPIGTFLMPAWERAISSGSGILAGSIGWMFAHKVDEMASPSRSLRYAANLTYMLSNRGAFIGSTLGYILNMSMGKTARKMADVGAAATAVGYAYTHPDSVMARGGIAATIGYWGSKALGRNKYIGLAIGGAVGAIDGLINKALKPADAKDWIPDRVKLKWDMEEYFDRMNYVKFMGLYQKAAKRAEKEEDVNLDSLIEMYSKSADQKKEIKRSLEDAKKDAKKYMKPDDPERKEIVHVVNQKLQEITDSQMIMKAGKWTHTALLYRQAALSTMYGAKSDASWMDLIRAVPKNERDYFLEFVKEKDPDKQKQILKTASPYLSRALQIAWGQKIKPMIDNKTYFSGHRLPGAKWAGWRPDIDLQNVEVKAIKNEGMLLGDFGFYESQLRDPGVINAPSIHPHGKKNGSIQIRKKLQNILEGQGLENVNIDVTEGKDDSVSTTFNFIKASAQNFSNSLASIFSF